MGSYITDYSRHEGGINRFIEDNHSWKEGFRKYRKRWDSIDTKSSKASLLFILLETISSCNLKCPMCIRSLGRENTDKMDDELFDLILENIKEIQVPSVCVNCNNEPLLDKDITNKINRISELDCVVDIFMNTNATLLTPEKSKEILNSNLTRLLIGFDAFTPQTYEKIRVGAKYHKVLGNILGFLELKKKMNKIFPILRISLVRLASNENEIDEWIDFWKDKVDQISIQEYATPVLDNSKDFLVARSNLRKQIKETGRTCIDPFQRAVIIGNGDVLPCCAHFSTKMPIGNIKNKKLKDIWNGQKASKLRETFEKGKWQEHPICAKCLSISSGLSIHSAL